MIYLDNSATTRQADEVTDLMAQLAREEFGNPSSLHPMGLQAQNRVTDARRILAKVLGATPEEIVFNSCGTEGDNTVLFGVAETRKHQGRKIITTAVEHPAVLEACKVLETRGYKVSYIGVDDKCRLNKAQLEEELSTAGRSPEDTPILVSVMAVNNETGTIMPVADAARLAHSAGALFHTDAVQAFGKIGLAGIGADFITMSGHKIHGPKGIGAMYIKKGVNLPAYLVGGGQERGMRSGTENVPAIAGLGKAVELMEQERACMGCGPEAPRKYLLEGIKDGIPDIIINSPESPEECVPSVLNVSFLGTRGEVILHTLEADGICVSTGSACSSNKKGQSHVLAAMGLSPKEIEGAIRFSFSRYNTIEEMDIVLDRLTKAVTRFRRLGSFR